MIRTANHSGYPRVGDSRELQLLRRSLAARDKGEVTDADLAAAEDEMTRRAIHEQIDAGLDLVTDGQIRWNDPVSHVLHRASSVEINGLLRFYDTNFYYRQPVIKDRPKWNGSSLAKDFQFAQKASSRPVRVVLTGPCTLSRLSVAPKNVFDALAEFVAREVEALVKAGAEDISIEEPELLKHSEDAGALRDALAGLPKRARVCLTTFFGDAAPLWDKLQEFPVHALGLDLTYSKTLPAKIGSGSSKALVLGIVDARNTRLESAADIAASVQKMCAKTKADVSLAPSCSLEYLPRDRSFAKLQRLSQAARLVSGKK